MKTRVEFRSHQFPPYEGEEAQINPGLWGKRLAEYFAHRLPEHGIKVGAPIAEDWGWYLPVVIADKNLAVCCGHQDGEDNQFLCFTDPAVPMVRKLFKTIDYTESLAQLVAALDAILSHDSGVHDVTWGDDASH